MNIPGRWIRLLVVLLALCIFQSVQAQTTLATICDDWIVEVCEDTLGYNLTEYPAEGCPDNCYRVYYHFYLAKQGVQNNHGSDETFSFVRLTVTGELAATFPGLSEVNLKESVGCSATNPGVNDPSISNSPLLDYDTTTNKFVYEVSSSTTPGATLNWAVFGRIPLFVLAVDVRAGETVRPENLQYLIVTSSSYCPHIVYPCHTSDDLYKTIDELPGTAGCTSTNGNPQLHLGSPVSASSTAFPNRQKVPVWVSTSGSSLSWSELDFTLSAIPGQNVSMLAPYIESGLVPAESVRVYPSPLTGQEIYTHHISSMTIPYATGPISTNTLFYLVFDGPALESECASETIDFIDAGRLDGGDFSCCLPRKAGNQVVTWQGTHCVTSSCSSLQLGVTPSTGLSDTICGKVLYFDLLLSSTQVDTVSDVRAVLKIKKNGSFTLDTALTSSPYCSSGTCLSIDTSGGYLRIVYEVSGVTNLTFAANAPNNSRRLATIALKTTTFGCIDGITVLDAVTQRKSASVPCLAQYRSGFAENDPDDDICVVGGSLEISAKTYNSGENIAGWTYYVNEKAVAGLSGCKYSGTSLDGSTVSRCVCLDTSVVQNVILHKAGTRDDYLNGVTTFDLVLIGKHILGSLPLSNNFSILAADANGSGTITTSDIVLFKQLILGIITSLPEANSWRFIDKNLENTILSTNTNPLDIRKNINMTSTPAYSVYPDREVAPFKLPPPTSVTDSTDSKAEFIGIKVGDVDGNAEPGNLHAQPVDRTAANLTFGIGAIQGKASTVVEIPVFSIIQQSLVGWQLALQFDTALLQVTGIRWPNDLPPNSGQDRDWNLLPSGELRLLWYTGREAVPAAIGTTLFYVQARLRQDVKRKQPLLQLAHGDLWPEAYDAQQRTYNLLLTASDMALLPVAAPVEKPVAPTYRLSVYPNPAGQQFRLDVQATAPASARLEVHDLMGRLLDGRTLNLEVGQNTLSSRQLPALLPGQYVFTLYTPVGVQNLRFVQQ